MNLRRSDSLEIFHSRDRRRGPALWKRTHIFPDDIALRGDLENAAPLALADQRVAAPEPLRPR